MKKLTAAETAKELEHIQRAVNSIGNEQAQTAIRQAKAIMYAIDNAARMRAGADPYHDLASFIRETVADITRDNI